VEIVSIYTPGKYDLADSYGLIASMLARHFTQMGIRVNALSFEAGKPAYQPDDIREIVEQPIQASLGGIILGYPVSHRKHGAMAMAGPRVAITMFESTRLPPGWVDALNQCDTVIVPSAFCEQVFLAEGVTVPIVAMPLGIDATYQPVRRDSSSEPFTFLAFADRGRRKGSHEAIQAFLKAFGDDPRYQLLLKAREREVTINILNDNIHMIQKDMDTQELYELYSSAHCMIFASKGEGFGLPPREFAASGGVAIATNWSGTSEYIHKWGLPLGYSLAPAWIGHSDFEKLELGEWAEPDMEALVELMHYIANSREAVLEDAYHSASWLHELYSWRRFAECVYSVWQDASERWANGKRSAA